MLKTRVRAARVLFSGMSVAAAAVLMAHSAFADPRDFRLQNSSSVDIAYVYISPSGADTWGDDAMGTDILHSGSGVDMNYSGSVDDTCVYDIKVVGTQGEEGYLYKVDLCSVTTVTFHN
jgi:hypothetical protein